MFVVVPLNVNAPAKVVVVALVVEPIAIVVVLPAAPLLPMLMVFVLPDAVTPLAMLVVCDAVDEPNVSAPVAAVPPIVIVPVVCAVAPITVPVVPETLSVVNAPVLGVVAPMLMLLIVPTPVDVKVNVGVLPAVSVIKFVYAAPSTSYAANANVFVLDLADLKTDPDTKLPPIVIVSVSVSPKVMLPVALSVVKLPAAVAVAPIAIPFKPVLVNVPIDVPEIVTPRTFDVLL